MPLFWFALLCIWMLLIPWWTNANIESITEAEVDLSSVEIKIVAFLCAIVWPIVVLYATVSFVLFGARESE